MLGRTSARLMPYVGHRVPLTTPVRSLSKFVLPERFKGTFLEKWVNYWKSLIADYKSMLADLRTEVQENPRKAIKYCALAGTVTALARTNPTYEDYRDQQLDYANRLALVGEEVRNRRTVEHMKRMEEAAATGVLARLNCGVLSVMWLRDCDPQCDMYAMQCPYTSPGYLTPFTRIVDLGIAGRWWNIYRLFQDYDINEQEWHTR